MRPLPRRQEIEIPKLLRELYRVVDDALLLVVPAHLDEAGERKILAERMPLEAVVGEQAAQVRMTGEHHAVKIVDFALEPVGSGKHIDQGRDGRRFIDLDLHADSLI